MSDDKKLQPNRKL